MEKFEHLGYEYHDLVPPTGHRAGGLALFWKQEINLEVLDATPNLFDTYIVYEGKPFFASFVYGDNDKFKKRFLWNHLLNHSEIRDSAWFITGDCYDLLHENEKNGGPPRPEGSFSDMRYFFAEEDLFDLPYSRDFLS